MKKRIYVGLLIVCAISIVLITSFSLAIFYNFYKDQVQKDLKTETTIIAQSFEVNNDTQYLKALKSKNNTLRITLISKDGEIIFESDSDYNQMTNHNQRPEVIEARKKGFGEEIRHSQTINKSTFYFAVLLGNGDVLRIGKQADNIVSVFASITPLIILLSVFILILCLYISKFLTKKIVKPIDCLAENIDSQNEKIYDELLPFVNKINYQNKMIKKQVKKVKREKEKLEQITQNMAEGLILIDTNKIILSINKSAAKLFDLNKYKKSDYLKKNILNFTRNAEFIEQINNITNSENDIDKNSFILFVAGRYINVYLNRVFDGEKFIGVLCLMLDITDKWIGEKARKEFTANVSHELKTPLTSISGYAEMIEQGIVKQEDLTKFAGKIKKEADRLLLLITDIIKLSEIDEPKINTEFEQVDLTNIIKECIESLEYLINDKDINVLTQFEEICLNANKKMIHELFFNLCENAIRYNKKSGKLIISTKTEDEKAVIIIEDTGIGISQEHQKRVFERFYRVDKSRSKATGGTGLGLSIVKHVIEQHKGKINLESTVGIGTKITITLPLQ